MGVRSLVCVFVLVFVFVFVCMSEAKRDVKFSERGREVDWISSLVVGWDGI